jgi:hypothetical protein
MSATDWRSGQKFDHAIFFGEAVDIHHIFPKDWCGKRGIKPEEFDSIINKTPLAYRTNRIIGGVAPSAYLAKMEAGGTEAPAIDPAVLDRHLRSHLIDPALLVRTPSSFSWRTGRRACCASSRRRRVIRFARTASPVRALMTRLTSRRWNPS